MYSLTSPACPTLALLLPPAPCPCACVGRTLTSERAKAELDALPNPMFEHRLPMSRTRGFVLTRPPIVSNPLATAAITIYSSAPAVRTGVGASVARPPLSSVPFGRNSSFSTPILQYKGDSKWFFDKTPTPTF